MSGFPDGWTYSTEYNNHGLCLRDLKHDGHDLLSEAFIVKSYAQKEDSNGSSFNSFEIGTDGMNVSTSTTQRRPNYDAIGGGRSPDYYHTLSSQVYEPFTITDLAGCAGQDLDGRQYYAFTAPSDTPRHETTGFAKAGRFYPSLDFELPEKKQKQDAGHISKLRFDYLFDLHIAGGGRRHSVTNPLPGLTDLKNYYVKAYKHAERSLMSGQIPGNIPAQKPRRERNYAPMNKEQAGLFKDLDTNIVWRTIGRLPGAGKHTFSAAEKPLIWEVVGDGILNGPGHPPAPSAGYWGNIHAWGYNSNGLVSTPGMPYGFHLHWRWESSVTDKTSMILGRWTQGFLGDPELAGRDINNNPVYGGPLIDPRLPLQDLRIAFVKKETAFAYAKETATSHDEFEEIFKRIKAKPDVIKDGDDCVVIISIVVHRDDPAKRWEGTIFPHGIFFPHTYDPPLPLLVGLPFELAYSEQYISQKPSSQKWKRNPS